jgi:hypothetical protein
LRDYLAAKVEDMGREELTGQTAAAFAAIVRQLAILNREIALDAKGLTKAAVKKRKAPTDQPDFGAMNEAEIAAYLTGEFDGGSSDPDNVLPFRKAVSAVDDPAVDTK